MKNKTTSTEALKKLKDGNVRFVSGLKSINALYSQAKMKELADNGQAPFAIVLTCSDSRSPVEMIFDQGLGDLFVVRVAGNVVAPSLIASMEFAAANFESSLLVVMGHTQCGAISATLEHIKNPKIRLPSGHLEELVGRIRPAVEEALRNNRDLPEDKIPHVSAIENIQHSIRLIAEQSTILRSLQAQGKLAIHGAILNIADGSVDWLEQA